MNKFLRKCLMIICCVTCVAGLTASSICFAQVSATNETSEYSVTNAQILSGINDNTATRTYTVQNGDTVYAEITAGYGTIGTNEQAFEEYHSNYFQGNNWTWISSDTSGDFCWHGKSDTYGKDVFLKAEIKKDGYLALSHPATGVHGNEWKTQATAKVIRIRDGETKVISSISVNKDENNEANTLLKDAGNVKVGDIIYVALCGEYETNTYFNPVFTFSETKPLYIIKDNAAILSEINADATGRKSIVSDEDSGDVYAEITAGYGAIGTSEQAFEEYHSNYFQGDNWTWISSDTSGDFCWHGNSGTYGREVYLKAEIKKDSYLALSHPATGVHSGGSNQAITKVVRVRDGKTEILFANRVKNSENNEANTLLKDAGNVKAGDVIYVSVYGEGETRLYFNPVFTFSGTKPEANTAEKANESILAEIYANTETRKSTVYNTVNSEVYAEITAGYGTIGTANEKTFDEYHANYLQGDNWSWISSDTSGDFCWHGNSDTYGKDVFLKAEIKKDGYLALTHPATGVHSNTWKTQATAKVIRVRNGKAVTISSISVKKDENNEANTLLKDVGNVKAGDIIYVALCGDYTTNTYFNPVFTFSEKRDAGFGGTYTMLNMIESVCTDEVPGEGETYDASDRNLFNVRLGYGKLGSDEKQFTKSSIADGSVSNDDGTVFFNKENVGSTTNSNSVFIEFKVKTDGSIRLYNPAGFVAGKYFTWTNVSVTKKENGILNRVYVSDRNNKNGEGKDGPVYNEGEFFDYTANVKAGDSIYLSVHADNAEDGKYGYQIPSGFLNVTFAETKEIVNSYESANIGTMVYNVYQSKGEYVKNGDYTAYTLATGTPDRIKNFESYEENILSTVQGDTTIASMDAAGGLWVTSQNGTTLAVKILKDCDFRFTHPVIQRGTWAFGYTRVRICRRTDENGLEELLTTPVSTLELPANYYCPDTYKAKAGEVYTITFETTDSYYAATTLPFGYEAAEKLTQLTQRETINNAAVINYDTAELYTLGVYEINEDGALTVMQNDGLQYTSANGSVLTEKSVTVAENKKVAVKISAKENIRLNLIKTAGVSDKQLYNQEKALQNADLASGDYIMLYFNSSVDSYELELTADASKYTAAARLDGATKESYDLFDMMNQLAFGGDDNNFNQRKLSTFKLESGKWYGTRQTLICTDLEKGHFINPDATTNTGVEPVFFHEGNDKMGVRIFADNGYDTIITVTAKKDSLVNLTHTVMNDEQWALSTYIKVLAVDTDGTSVVLLDKQMTKTYAEDAFAATVNLKAGQSLAVVYYTSTTLYGAAYFLPTFTFDTQAYDANDLVDFSAAKALREYKEQKSAELAEYYNTLNENDYSGTNWLEIGKLYESGKEKIMDAADESTVNQIFEETKTQIGSIKTQAQIKAELDEVKAAKLAELDEVYNSLNKKEYTSANWSNITQIYENAKRTISNQLNATKVENAFQTAKTAMLSVEKLKASDLQSKGCKSGIATSGAISLLLTAVGATLIRRKRNDQ